jgi:hypothetical protein
MESDLSVAWTRKDAYQHELQMALDALRRAKRIRFSFKTEESNQKQTEKNERLIFSLMQQMRKKNENNPIQPEVRSTRSRSHPPQIMLLQASNMVKPTTQTTEKKSLNSSSPCPSPVSSSPNSHLTVSHPIVSPPPIPPPPILYTTSKKRKSRWDIGPVTEVQTIPVQKRRFTRWDR